MFFRSMIRFPLEELVPSPLVIAAFCFVIASGCGPKVTAPPPELVVEDAPNRLQEAAQAASNAEAQALLNEAVAAFQAQDYPRALFILQSLSARPDLTPDQQRLVASSLLAVNKALAEQANAGNAQAQEAVRRYRATK